MDDPEIRINFVRPEGMPESTITELEQVSQLALALGMTAATPWVAIQALQVAIVAMGRLQGITDAELIEGFKDACDSVIDGGA